MSETTTAPAQGEAPPPEYRPDEFLSSDDGIADPNPPAPQESTPEKPAEPEQPAEKPERSAEEKRADNEARRIAQLTRMRYAEKARADEAERRRAELEDRLHRLENNGQPAPQDIDTAVQTRAEAIIAQREAQARINAFHEAGTAAYGDWAQRCQDLQEMGADAGFAELLVELPNGATVAGALAEDPRELERIAGIRSERGRAIELARYGAKLEAKPAVLAPPAAAAKAPIPAPIRPPSGGRAAAEPDPERGGYDEYSKWSAKINWSNR